MTVSIVDFLICGEGFGIWMCGERRCLVKRFDIGEVNRRIIMLVRFEIFIEGFEHSNLRVLVWCFRDLDAGEEYIEAYICPRSRLAHSSHDRGATSWTELENSRSEYIFLGVGCRWFGRTHIVFQGFVPELVLCQRTFALMNCEIFVAERPYSDVSILWAISTLCTCNVMGEEVPWNRYCSYRYGMVLGVVWQWIWRPRNGNYLHRSWSLDFWSPLLHKFMVVRKLSLWGCTRNGVFWEAKQCVGCLICVMQHRNGMTCLFYRIGPSGILIFVLLYN